MILDAKSWIGCFDLIMLELWLLLGIIFGVSIFYCIKDINKQNHKNNESSNNKPES